MFDISVEGTFSAAHQVKGYPGDCAKKLDHTTLNKLPFFKKHNATAEWVAVYIYNEMKKKIKAITSVTVWEGQNNTVTYYEE